jgi:hypothetical protein
MLSPCAPDEMDAAILFLKIWWRCRAAGSLIQSNPPSCSLRYGEPLKCLFKRKRKLKMSLVRLSRQIPLMKALNKFSMNCRTLPEAEAGTIMPYCHLLRRLGLAGCVCGPLSLTPEASPGEERLVVVAQT